MFHSVATSFFGFFVPFFFYFFSNHVNSKKFWSKVLIYYMDSRYPLSSVGHLSSISQRQVIYHKLVFLWFQLILSSVTRLYRQLIETFLSFFHLICMIFPYCFPPSDHSIPSNQFVYKTFALLIKFIFIIFSIDIKTF